MSKTQKAAHVTMLSILVSICVGIVGMTALELAPIEWWVEYHDIYPVQKHFKIGEPVRFVSHLTVRRTVDTAYNDILRCKKGSRDSYTFYDDQSTKHLRLEPSDGDFEAPWLFKTSFTEPDECYLESHVQAKVFFGIEKYYNHESEPFFIVEENINER